MGCDEWICHTAVNHAGVAPCSPQVCQITLHCPWVNQLAVQLHGFGMQSAGAWQPELCPFAGGRAVSWGSPGTASESNNHGSAPASGKYYWVLKAEESTLQAHSISVQLPKTFCLPPGWANCLKHCCPPGLPGAEAPLPAFLRLGAVWLNFVLLKRCSNACKLFGLPGSIRS